MNRSVKSNSASLVMRIAILTMAGVSCLYAQDLPASADALVDTLYPTVNFGAATYLEAGGTTTTYVRFDLSSLPAGILTSPSTKVNLVLWVGRLGTAGTLQVSQTSAA